MGLNTVSPSPSPKPEEEESEQGPPPANETLAEKIIRDYSAEIDAGERKIPIQRL
jgi:hypothetical protein